MPTIQPRTLLPVLRSRGSGFRRVRFQRGAIETLSLAVTTTSSGGRQGIVASVGCRNFATPPPSNGQKPKEPSGSSGDDDESHLNWKDRKEAPKWMRRIAPTKGGKWPPSPQEALILASGLALFVWSWTA